MNWDHILSGVFGITILFLIFITLLFYTEHLVSRRRRKNNVRDAAANTRFFERYLPDSLRSRVPVSKATETKDSVRTGVILWIMGLFAIITLGIWLGFRHLQKIIQIGQIGQGS